MKVRIVYVLLLICFLWSNRCLAQQISDRMQAQLDKLTHFYVDKLKEHKMIGSSLAIVKDGRVIYHHNYGLARVESHQPVTDQTIFHWASNTKTFTGIAIMQLRDRGLLNLDDPVTKYIPSLHKIYDPYGSVDDITIRQLMTHTAGFRNPSWPFAGGDKDEIRRWLPHEPQHWYQLVALFPYTKLLFKPGTDWSYSNLGIIFLGRIIEKLTKDDYEYYIQKNILLPLKMHHTYFDDAPYSLLPDLAQSYFMKSDTLTPKLGPEYYIHTHGTTYLKARFNLNTGITVSNGGLNAPVSDMVKYMSFLLGNAPDDAYKYVLSRSSLKEMFQPQADIPSDAGEPINIVEGKMGLDFFIQNSFGTHAIGHAGSQNGFLSHILFSPAKDMGFIVVYNNDGETRQMDLELQHYLFKNIFSLVK